MRAQLKRFIEQMEPNSIAIIPAAHESTRSYDTEYRFRQDSDFWRDNRAAASVPDRLAELLALWRFQPPSRYDLHRVEEVFPSASYQYVLYGMGFRPEPEGFSRRMDDADRADEFFREAARLTHRMLGALPANRALIQHIQLNGLPRT